MLNETYLIWGTYLDNTRYEVLSDGSIIRDKIKNRIVKQRTEVCQNKLKNFYMKKENLGVG